MGLELVVFPSVVWLLDLADWRLEGCLDFVVDLRGDASRKSILSLAVPFKYL